MKSNKERLRPALGRTGCRCAAQAGLGLVPEDRRIIPGLTVEENLKLAQIAPPIGWSIDRLYNLFPRLGERRNQEGTTLSGGEQQRVAIARALVHEPALILGDEPTGNLDKDTGQAITNLLFDLHSNLGSTLILVTHDASLASRCDRQLHLASGALRENSADDLTHAISS